MPLRLYCRHDVPTETVSAGELSESRKALQDLLNTWTQYLEKQSSERCKIKINWRLGHSRNPKGLNEQNKNFKRRTSIFSDAEKLA